MTPNNLGDALERRLSELARAQDELDRRRRAQREWVSEHGYPPPLSRWRRFRLFLRHLV